MPRVLLLFLDGVGLGDEDPSSNPFMQASMPCIAQLLGGLPVVRATAPAHTERASLVAMDATLGHDGIPQSGTGQTALLTGADAVTMHGRHFGPWVPARLQRLVREESLLASARLAGWRVAFANAYPEEALDAVNGVGLPSDVPGRQHRRQRRGPTFLRAGPPLAAFGAGLLNRHTSELADGNAVASEITNDGWRRSLGRTSVPEIDAPDAGRNLAAIATAHDLTLFAHYTTDYAGHRREMDDAVTALERVDAFLSGVLDALPPDMLLFVVSDHGNIEDVRTGHTRNPALAMVVGQGHALLSRRLRRLTDVTPTILDTLPL
ncbi:MAG TPA: alkaline phosphatase family protein [Longimicrobiales bacterium]|nr:alkaline phosphatase family protein [Longimicrobiales bacterium]